MEDLTKEIIRLKKYNKQLIKDKEELQQRIDTATNFIDQVICYDIGSSNRKADDHLNMLIGILMGKEY